MNWMDEKDPLMPFIEPLLVYLLGGVLMLISQEMYILILGLGLFGGLGYGIGRWKKDE